MIDINQLDPANLATISAIVAALVTVVGNAFKLPASYRGLLAIGVAFIMVFLPPYFLNKILTALIIGLTASGVYSQVKPRRKLDQTQESNNQGRNNKSNQNTTITNMAEDTEVNVTRQPSNSTPIHHEVDNNSVNKISAR